MPKISKEISAWFDYPDDPQGGKVHVRLLKSGEFQLISEKTLEIRNTFNDETNQNEVTMARRGFRASVVVKSIKEWENFFDVEDKPMKCTPLNIKLMCCEDGFVEFIETCIEELEKQKAAKDNAILKN